MTAAASTWVTQVANEISDLNALSLLHEIRVDGTSSPNTFAGTPALVLYLLANYVSNEWICRPHPGRLARDTGGLSSEELTAAIRELEMYKLITTTVEYDEHDNPVTAIMLEEQTLYDLQDIKDREVSARSNHQE